MILEYLKGKAEGKQNAIPAMQLCEHFKVSKRELRDIVVKEIVEDRAIIASCNDGYYIPLNDIDYAIGRAHLLGPFEMLKKRINAYEFNWRTRNQGELGI